MRILVTGARGFVGGSFGREAALAGHCVLGVARSAQPEPDWPGQYLQADVAHVDLSAVVRDFRPDVVFHGAGSASVGNSLNAPLDDLRAAVVTWANTLDAVRRSGLRPHLLFPSSAAVYGDPASLPVSEDMAVRPISPYGFHKAACELLAREYAQCFGLDITVCRLFSVFGPAQRRLLVWEIYRQATGPDAAVVLQGTGAETRDYLAMEDVATALIRIAEGRRAENEPPRLQVVNVGSGRETRVLDLAKQVCALVSPEKPVCCLGRERPGDPVRWQAETTRLRSLLPDWQPRPFEDRLAGCVAHWSTDGDRGPATADGDTMQRLASSPPCPS